MAIGTTPIMTADGERPSLGAIDCERLGAREPFHDGGRALGFDVLAFWRWSTSDLVSNATRGALAEHLVAQALGISHGGVREEWAECDLEAPDGTLVEVKSAAYIQSRRQERLSQISFRDRDYEEQAMRVKYFADTDTTLVELADGPPVETRELDENI
ncbi:MAG: DUF2283 domain-containing protein [Actinomycetes bacterium]